MLRAIWTMSTWRFHVSPIYWNFQSVGFIACANSGNCAALAFVACSSCPSFPCSYSKFPSPPWDWRDSMGEDGGGVGPRIWFTSAPARSVVRLAANPMEPLGAAALHQAKDDRSTTGEARCQAAGGIECSSQQGSTRVVHSRAAAARTSKPREKSRPPYPSTLSLCPPQYTTGNEDVGTAIRSGLAHAHTRWGDPSMIARQGQDAARTERVLSHVSEAAGPREQALRGRERARRRCHCYAGSHQHCVTPTPTHTWIGYSTTHVSVTLQHTHLTCRLAFFRHVCSSADPTLPGTTGLARAHIHGCCGRQGHLCHLLHLRRHRGR